MARIRTIKPEFFGDRRLATDASRDQRLCYIGLWNEADDEGRLQADPRRLLGVIFPYDEDLTPAFIGLTLMLLARTERAVLYEVHGEPYCQLTKFLGHQRINRPTPSKIPAPPTSNGHLIDHSVSTHLQLTEASSQEGKGKEEERKGVERRTKLQAGVRSFCEKTGATWKLATDIAAWSEALIAEPHYAGLDLPLEITRCAEWYETQDRTPKAPDRAIRNWLERSALRQQQQAASLADQEPDEEEAYWAKLQAELT